MASNIPITAGSGTASVATEQIGAVQYQKIKVVGGETGSTSVWGIAPDGSAKVSVVGTITATLSGTPSISGAVTVVGTPSISGTVNIGVIPGSVVAFQGGTQITSLVSTVPSSVIVGASIFGALPAGNAVLGAVAASISGTVTATLTGTPSISGAVTIVGNTSVSGTIGASILGTPDVAISRNVVSAGSDNASQLHLIAGQATNSNSPIGMANYVYNSSITGWDRLRGDSSIGALVSTGGSSVIALIRGSVATALMGTPSISGAVTVVGTPSISGTINIGTIPGSVVAFQGTTPWTIGSVYGNISGSVFAVVSGLQGASVSGTVNASVLGWVPTQPSNTSTIGVIQGSVATVIIGGSIAATFTPPANQSVSGTVGASVIGHAPVVIVGGSILTSSTANQSVSGTVGASVVGTVPTTQSGTTITSIVSSTPSSVLVGASIFGQLPAGTAPLGSVATLQGTNPWIITGSVQGSFSPSGNQSVSGAVNVSGSILLGSSNASVIGVLQTSSLIAINTGSVVAISQGSVIAVLQAPSIVGTYTEDVAHATADKGVFVLGVRNDTLSSMTSADGDYSPVAVGPIGENVVANAPITKWVQGTADLRGSTGGSVAVIAAQGASVFTYITGLQLANMGSASVLVTLSGATSSIIGYTIAPAGGGSNIIYTNALKTNANGAFTASISGVSSVLVSAQGFIAKI